MTDALNCKPGEIVFVSEEELYRGRCCLALEKRIFECEKLLTLAVGDAAWGYLGELYGLLAVRAGRPEDAAVSTLSGDFDPREVLRSRCQRGYQDGAMLIQLEGFSQKGVHDASDRQRRDGAGSAAHEGASDGEPAERPARPA
jgi:hypothetical protein